MLAFAACLPSVATADDIAFTSNKDGDVRLNILHDSTLRPVHTPLQYAEAPNWFPDGQRLVFHGRHEDTSAPDIYMVTPTTGKVVRLTDHAARDEFPAVSPDGKSIAFMSTREQREDRTSGWIGSEYDIYLMASDGTAQRRLTTELRGTEHPAWSPDGRRIAFSAPAKDARATDGKFTVEDSFTDICVVTVDGGSITRVTSQRAICLHPGWSPDGKQIAFCSNAHGKPGDLGDLQIYVVQVDGNNLTQVSHRDSQNIYPRWSPNGRRILFHATPVPQTVENRSELVMIDWPNGTTEILVAAGSHAYFPAWKPETQNHQQTK
jgi:TolB protein